ncbi:MAG: DUF2505 domain-containing protein [Actinobacteria bacterium]|nr:DUF2505 domain-containing protein [Actinomycetota bacterium]
MFASCLCDDHPMSTPLDVVQAFAADAFRTFGVLTNREYIEAKCSATGSLRTTIDISGDASSAITVRTERLLPANVPAVAQSFVGETIDVTEVQEWSAPDHDGSRSAIVTVKFSGPLRFEGTADLRPTSQGCSIHTLGRLTAKVPFVGGTIEQEAARQTEKYLRVEESLAAEWLGRA